MVPSQKGEPDPVVDPSGKLCLSCEGDLDGKGGGGREKGGGQGARPGMKKPRVGRPNRAHGKVTSTPEEQVLKAQPGPRGALLQAPGAERDQRLVEEGGGRVGQGGSPRALREVGIHLEGGIAWAMRSSQGGQGGSREGRGRPPLPLVSNPPASPCTARLSLSHSAHLRWPRHKQAVVQLPRPQCGVLRRVGEVAEGADGRLPRFRGRHVGRGGPGRGHRRDCHVGAAEGAVGSGLEEGQTVADGLAGRERGAVTTRVSPPREWEREKGAASTAQEITSTSHTAPLAPAPSSPSRRGRA